MPKVLVVCGGAGRGLIGKREALGFDAELQVDIGEEIVGENQDPRSFRVNLSAEAGTLRELLHSDLRAATDGQDREFQRHAQVLYDGHPVQGVLVDGLKQRPAIGGAAVRQQANVDRLRATAVRIAREIGAQQGQRISVWIVSSTAGGTGAGIRRFVATVLAQQFARQNLPVSLCFLLYGARTYTSIEQEITSRNTFMGILQDLALLIQGVQVEVGPQPACYFYYLEIPDVGRDKAKREELVAVTARALWAKDLEIDLGAAVNNTDSHTALVRVGFWNGRLPENQLYYEVLLQLRDRLRQLIEPDAKQFTAGYTCQVESDSLEEAKRAISSELLKSLEDWKFPSPREYRIGGIQGKEKKPEEYLKQCDEALSKLLERAGKTEGMSQIQVVFSPRPQADGAQGQQVADQSLARPLHIPRVDKAPDWAQRQELVLELHRVMAWCDVLQSPPDGRLSDQRLTLAKECFNTQHQRGKGSETIANELAPKLQQYLDVTIRLARLTELRIRASQQLSELQGPFAKILETVDEELRRITQAGNLTQAKRLVVAAGFGERVLDNDARTWIELLHEACTASDLAKFREYVRKGATGLTRAGLKTVLEADSDDTHAMQEEMKKVGKHMEGSWWQGVAGLEQAAADFFRYRIHPKLDFTEKLPDMDKIKFVVVPISFLGDLRVLAVDIINLNPVVNMYQPATKLLEGVREYMKVVLLSEWQEDSQGKLIAQDGGAPTDVVRVAESGVGGEPIAVKALEGLNGWTQDYTRKLMRLFRAV